MQPDLSNYSPDELRAMLRINRRTATARVVVLKREIRERADELEGWERQLKDITYSEERLGSK